MEELDLTIGVTLEDITWKNLTGDIQDNQAIEGALEEKANTNEVVDLTGDQTIEGIKSFSDNMYIGSVENPANLGIAGELTINGAIIQNGSAYETHAEKIYTKNDYVILRDGAVSGLLNGDYTGLKFNKYDGTNTGVLAVDNTGTARVGDSGDEQPLLTRSESDNLTDGGLLFWDSVNNKAVNLSTVTVDNEGNLTATSFSGNIENAVRAIQDSEGNVIVDTYANRLLGNLSNNVVVYNKLLTDYHSTYDGSKFTVVGNPTISDDGIASGFSSSNYVRVTDIDFSKPFVVYANETVVSTLSGIYGAFNVQPQLLDGVYFIIAGSGSLYSNYNFAEENSVTYRVSWDGQTYKLEIKGDTVKTNWTTVKTYSSTTPLSAHYLTLGFNNNSLLVSNGVFDLKQFSITVNGVSVFSGNQTGMDSYIIDGSTVTLPYTLTSIGDKIVDMSYLTTVEEVTNYLGYNNYALIDETNSQFIMPQGYIQNKVYNIQQNVMGMIEVFNNLNANSTEIYTVAEE